MQEGTILDLLNKVDLPLLKMATGEDSEVDNKDLEDTVEGFSNNSKEGTAGRIVDLVISEVDHQEVTGNNHHLVEEEGATVNSSNLRVTEEDTRNLEEDHKVDSTIEVLLVCLPLHLPLLQLPKLRKLLLEKGRERVVGDRNRRTLRCQ